MKDGDSNQGGIVDMLGGLFGGSGSPMKDETITTPIKITPDKKENISTLTQIAKKHLELMQRLVNINEAVLKNMSIQSKGDGNSNNIFNVGGNSQTANMAQFGNNRNGYVNSHYAFA